MSVNSWELGLQSGARDDDNVSMSCTCPTREDLEGGVTLVEVMVAMVIFGILTSIAVLGLTTVRKQLEARGSQREAVTQLRNVQVRAVAEDVAYCVDFPSATPNAMKVYRVPGADLGALPSGFQCSSGTSVSSYTAPGQATFSNVSFQQRDGSVSRFVLFFTRGAASPGSFSLGGGGGKTYQISVDGLTGRVASSGA